jgi:hypothetical protein
MSKLWFTQRRVSRKGAKKKGRKEVSEFLNMFWLHPSYRNFNAENYKLKRERKKVTDLVNILAFSFSLRLCVNHTRVFLFFASLREPSWRPLFLCAFA